MVKIIRVEQNFRGAFAVECEEEAEEEDDSGAMDLASIPADAERGSVLREAMFMVPQKAEIALPITAEELHKQIMLQLSARFGGCYVMPVLGAWSVEGSESAPPGVIIEGMVCVTVAIREGEQRDFRDYALAAGRAFKQPFVFWRGWNGGCHMEPVIEGRMH